MKTWGKKMNRKNAVLSKFSNILFLSFILPFLMMLGLIIYREIYPFGKNSFMFTDMYHQYVPFLTGLWDKLHGGGSLQYTFRIGLGTNYTAIFAYYLASPVNWLCYFVRRENIMEFMTFVILLKIALSGLTFCFYLSRRFEKKEICMVWFSVFYAMSGYVAAYYWNHMWLDCILLAPLVLLGLEELILKGKVKRYILCLAFCILTNYYLSILFCIFLVLYFLMLLFTKGLSVKNKLLACIRFAVSSLLAGSMAGVLLVPVLYSMQGTGFLHNSLPKKVEIYFDFLSMLARHVPMLETERRLDHWPNIYCGVFVFVLIPLYFFSRKIKLREKIGHTLLLGIFFASFAVNVLNFIWHGMNYPNSLPARQSFLYILVVLTMCCEAVLAEKETGRKAKIMSLITGVAVLILCSIFVTKEEFTVEVFACAYIFLAGYFVLKVVFGLAFQRKGWSKIENWTILLLVCVEAFLNLEETAFATTYRDKYVERQADYEEFYALARADLGEEGDILFRMDNDRQITKNDASLAGYYSVSVFSSTTNSRVRKLYERLGMGGSKVSYYHAGATPFTEALLSMHYRISDREEPDTAIYKRIADNGPEEEEKDLRFLYRNEAALPLGVVLDEKTVTAVENILEEYDSNCLVRQNRIAVKLGCTESLFSALSEEEIIKQPDRSEMTVKVAEDGYLYAAIPFEPEGEVTFETGETSWTEKELNKNRLYYAGYYRTGEEIKISAPDEEKFYMKFYRLNERALLQLSEHLKENAFTESSHGENYIEGTISAKEDGMCVFSIPTEDGFQIFLDGKQVQSEEFYDSMIMIPVTAGEHEVRIAYQVQGLYTGAWISVCSIILFCVYTRKRKDKKNDR